MKNFIPAIVLILVIALVLGCIGCSGGHKSSRSDVPFDDGAGIPNNPPPPAGSVDLPFGESSDGTGGTAANGTTMTTSTGIEYRLICPDSYDGSPNELLVVYSGTEGASMMTSNLLSLGPQCGIGAFICAILDGPVYRGNGQAGADVLDELRSLYNISNDRMYLLGESAGTDAAAELGFNIRQEYFAAYWANDITTAIDGYAPSKTAGELGFAPWGNVGPGGKVTLAEQIVSAMRDAGYRLPDDAPYSGPGYLTHGSPAQLQAALSFFPGKSRQ